MKVRNAMFPVLVMLLAFFWSVSPVRGQVEFDTAKLKEGKIRLTELKSTYERKLKECSKFYVELESSIDRHDPIGQISSKFDTLSQCFDDSESTVSKFSSVFLPLHGMVVSNLGPTSQIKASVQREAGKWYGTLLDLFHDIGRIQLKYPNATDAGKLFLKSLAIKPNPTNVGFFILQNL